MLNVHEGQAKKIILIVLDDAISEMEHHGFAENDQKFKDLIEAREILKRFWPDYIVVKA